MNNIIATNETITKIINSEIERLGLNADLNHIDVSNVTDMGYVFRGSLFNGDISKWDVSKVKDMRFMFQHSKFTGDISNWDVSNVRDIGSMFAKSAFTGKFNNKKYLNGIEVTTTNQMLEYNMRKL